MWGLKREFKFTSLQAQYGGTTHNCQNNDAMLIWFKSWITQDNSNPAFQHRLCR